MLLSILANLMYTYYHKISEMSTLIFTTPYQPHKLVCYLFCKWQRLSKAKLKANIKQQLNIA